ncbi:MAG TPA: anhydro-N-acetylmuramic acid kinase [Casimicrobiaceae bacterium]|nr:anhydro-N-acetylmuramic acid kinase [Casimicrobiaceae bacterium]
MPGEIYAGVMSGTSLDGIDAVVAEFSATGGACRTLGAAHLSMPAALRATLTDLQRAGNDELARAARAEVDLADLYAEAVTQAMRAARCTPDRVNAVGVHGQTVRHRPADGWTIQLNDPSRVAERLNIPVVADFRRRDIAAGGQGAPLVPAFHQAVFARGSLQRAVLNVGGIANLTLLARNGPVRGFDVGPGNVLLDAWHARHRDGRFDVDGAYAAGGHVDGRLLALLLSEPYFEQRPPKSTGRDLFDAEWLDARLARYDGEPAPADVQATLVELTAKTVGQALTREMPHCEELLVCGGGARNATLMQRLWATVAPMRLDTTQSEGVAVDQVEALAFAWLARQTLRGLAGNLPDVTGARGSRVLGAIYPK